MKTKLKLGQHRGNLRFWIEGKQLAAIGFEPGTLYTATFGKGKIALAVTFDGDRMVAKREVRGQLIGIIDINSAKLAESLGESCTHVNVVGTLSSIIIRPAK